MRILHVVKKYIDQVGGDAIYAKSLANIQLEKKHTVYVLTSGNKKEQKEYIYFYGFETRNLDVVSFARLFSIFSYIKNAIFIILKEKPQVIHFHSVEYSFLISIFCKILKIKTLMSVHCIVNLNKKENPIKKLLEKILFFFSFCDGYIVSNKKYLAFIKKQNVAVIPGGVESLNHDFKENIMHNDYTWKFLFVGRFNKIKGIEVLLEALNILKSKIKFTFTFLGEGELEQEIRKNIDKNKLQDIVSIEGPIFDRTALSNFYRLHDFLCISSLQETGPLTAFEALANGLFVISTDVGIVNDLFGETDRVLITKNNPHDFAAAMTCAPQKAITSNIKAKNVADYVRKNFSWMAVSEQIEAFYYRIINS